MNKSLLILPFLIPLVANADKAFTWLRIGPPAGEIQQILPDRGNPDVWYAINQGILYRSENRAQTWKPSPLRNVFFIAVHPVTSSIFALSGDASFESSNLWASADGGKTFQLRASFKYRLQKVILHPSKPEILYGLAPHGVLIVSGNGGERWFRCDLPVFDSQYDPVLDDLLISPVDQHTLYLSVTLWGYSDYDMVNFLLRSSNDGRSWKVEMKNWDSYSITFHTDPLFPGKAFAIHRVSDYHLAEVLMLTRGGWSRVSKTPAFDKLFSVARHENELLALSGAGSANSSVWQSLDDGQTWESVRTPEFLSPIMDLATVDNSLRGILLGSKDGGLYSKNERTEWVSSNSGFQESHMTYVGAAHSSPVVYAANHGGFLFKTRNKGRTWEELGPQLKTDTLTNLEVDPLNSNHLLFLGGKYDGFASLQVSTDGGNTWRVGWQLAVHDDCGPASFSSVNPEMIYMVCLPKLLRSTDGGKSFATLPTEGLAGWDYGHRVIPDEDDNSVLFIIASDSMETGAIFKSTDGGQTISKVFATPPSLYDPPIDMAPLPQKNAYLMATHRGRMFRTVNGGNSWQLLSRIGPLFVERLYAGRPAGKHFYAVIQRYGKSKLYESLDGGSKWKDITSEFGSGTNVFDLTDPRFHPFYAATDRGVFMEVVAPPH